MNLVKIKGDDIVFTHQILGPIKYGDELSHAPVVLNVGDTAKFFYELQDGTVDLVGFDGVPVGALPTSQFTVSIPAIKSKDFKSGEWMTVRAEITRLDLTKESHYLLNEISLLERGFITKPHYLELP